MENKHFDPSITQMSVLLEGSSYYSDESTSALIIVFGDQAHYCSNKGGLGNLRPVHQSNISIKNYEDAYNDFVDHLYDNCFVKDCLFTAVSVQYRSGNLDRKIEKEFEEECELFEWLNKLYESYIKGLFFDDTFNEQ